ncbi:hypothetical protein [Streptomyces sp. NPDC094466]|uniref:hypothetical protein n=1 Tax=Streptomyces sp. NPDC094466 TaxID=3366065 RepID=UPI0038225242
MAATAPTGTLLIVERAHRGGVESQFSDELYFARALHTLGGGLDVLLRGAAAGYAVVPESPPRPPRFTPHGSLPAADPRRSLHGLIADGAGVWVEERDLRALGPRAPGRVLPGVRVAGADTQAPEWGSYHRVWFF